MKIGILLHPYGEKEPAGLGRAIFELTKAMIAVAPEHEFLLFVKGNPSGTPDFSGTNWHMHSLGNGPLWLNRLRRAPSADIYLFNTPILPYFWGRKSVVLALDFAYRLIPPRSPGEMLWRLALSRYHRFSLSRASRIAAISDATKRDAIRLFGVREDKISTVRLGFNAICSLPEVRCAAPEKFFLFVGVLKARKNVHNIIRAFARFHSRHPEYTLLIVGRAAGSYADRLRQLVAAEKLGESVQFPGYRSEGELAYLYRRASALVYPSIIEGFGFPVLEAMDCGTPVITSNISCLPEVAGDAALLVDPHKIGEIAQAMEQMAVDYNLRRGLIERGHIQAGKFSWERSAREMLGLIKNV